MELVHQPKNSLWKANAYEEWTGCEEVNREAGLADEQVQVPKEPYCSQKLDHNFRLGKLMTMIQFCKYPHHGQTDMLAIHQNNEYAVDHVQAALL